MRLRSRSSSRSRRPRTSDPDPRVRAAARERGQRPRAQAVHRRPIADVLYGLSTGSILLLSALGLAITFGLMRVINMAHGEMLMLGAYATYVDPERSSTSTCRRTSRGTCSPRSPWRWSTTMAVGALPRAHGHPVPLRPPARDAPRHVRPQPAPHPDGAHDLRRAERGGREPTAGSRAARSSSRTSSSPTTASRSSSSPSSS